MQLVLDEHCSTLKVGEIVALAGVSRATFYEHFADREACLAAALASWRRRLLAELDDRVTGRPPEWAAGALAAGLVEFATAEPSIARVLLSDPLAGGDRMLDAHDRMLAELAEMLDRAFAATPAGAMVPDVCPRLLIGVICRLLATRLRRGQPIDRAMLEQLLRWLAGYERPAGEQRWRTLTPSVAPARSPYLALCPLNAPPPLPPDRPHVGEDAVSENHWLRIVFATAEIVARDGYAAATVTQITRTAGVDSRVFYRLFASKSQALTAAQELLFRHLMAATAGAFVTGESWPERLWEAARALTQSLEQNPTLSYVSFIESQAGTATSSHRSEDLVNAFTIFLQEGCRLLAADSEMSDWACSSLVQEAIVMCVFELGYLHARECGPHDADGISGLLAHVVFVCLAPFLGAVRASEFIAHKSASGFARPPVPIAAAAR